VPKLRLRAALCAILLTAPAAAVAQTGGSIAVTSDDRYRGVSLSDERPTLRLNVSHDAAGGWYVGASLASVALDPPRRQWQTLAYGGRAGKLGNGLGTEAGLLAVHFGADSRFDYHEWFAGISGGRWSTRLYVAPSYFGSGLRTAYAELNAGRPLSRSVRLSVHLGALVRIGGRAVDAERLHVDARAGIGWLHAPWDLQLDWLAGSRVGIYPVSYGHERGVVVLSASYAF
jgi:uncharacterized protein (TIGR02001 family)